MNRREARYASVDLLLDRGYLWLARDLNGSIAAYSHKPFKLDDEVWYNEIGESKEMWMWVDDGDLYNFVKWEDDKPVNIREWLEKEEEEMKMYSVKDGELECREVDADFFEKNTTLGGLLTSKEGELNNKKELPFLEFPYLTSNMMETDDANTIKVNTRNSGKSAILEKVKEIREMWSSPEAEMMHGLHPQVHRNLAALEVNSDHTLDVASMYPEQLTFDDLDNVKIHAKICQELTETYKKKNADYGNSFGNSLDKHGLIAGIIRMDDKMSRLISLNSKNEQQVMDESLRDTLMDLANYAIMSVMWLDEQ